MRRPRRRGERGLDGCAGRQDLPEEEQGLDGCAGLQDLLMECQILQITPPAQEAFESGTLLLPGSPVPGAQSAAVWSDVLVNSTLVVFFALLVLLNMRTFIHIIPQLLPTLSRWKTCLSLDHNIHLCRERGYAALILFVPFCLLADRYSLVRPSLFDTFPPQWRTGAVTGLLLLYVLLRRLSFSLCGLKVRRREAFLAAHRSSYGYFILMLVLLLASAGVCAIFKCKDLTISHILLVEILLCYLLAVVRKGQILNSFCNPFLTFLYLCGLELIPTGMLTAAVLLL